MPDIFDEFAVAVADNDSVESNKGDIFDEFSANMIPPDTPKFDETPEEAVSRANQTYDHAIAEKLPLPDAAKKVNQDLWREKQPDLFLAGDPKYPMELPIVSRLAQQFSVMPFKESGFEKAGLFGPEIKPVEDPETYHLGLFGYTKRVSELAEDMSVYGGGYVRPYYNPWDKDSAINAGIEYAKKYKQLPAFGEIITAMSTDNLSAFDYMVNKYLAANDVLNPDRPITRDMLYQTGLWYTVLKGAKVQEWYDTFDYKKFKSLSRDPGNAEFADFNIPKEKFDKWDKNITLAANAEYPAAAMSDDFMSMSEEEFQAYLTLLAIRVKQADEKRDRGFWGRTGAALRRGKESITRNIADLITGPISGDHDLVRRWREIEAIVYSAPSLQPTNIVERGWQGAAQMVSPMALSIALGGAGYGSKAVGLAGKAATWSGPATFWVTQIAPGRYMDMIEAGIAHEYAAPACFISAIPEALLENLQVKQLTPKIARAAKNAMFKSMAGYFGFAGKKMLKVYGTELGEEAIQGSIGLAVKAGASYLDKNAPGLDWEKELKQTGQEVGDAALSLPFLVIPGHLVSTAQALPAVRQQIAISQIAELAPKKADVVEAVQAGRTVPLAIAEQFKGEPVIDEYIAATKAKEIDVIKPEVKEIAPDTAKYSELYKQAKELGVKFPKKPNKAEVIEAINKRMGDKIPDPAETIQPSSLITPEILTVNEKLIEQLRTSRKLRAEEVEPIIKAFRARQASDSLEIMKAELKRGTSTEESIAKSLAGYKGEVEAPQITPPDLSPEEWTLYFNRILDVYPVEEIDVHQFDRTNTREALTHLRQGKIIPPHEVAYLARILGRDAAEQIYGIMERYMSPGERKWQYLMNLVSLAKVKFAFDVQFLRQASSFALRHPAKYIQGSWVAIRSYLSEDYATRIERDTMDSPRHEDAKKYLHFLETTRYAPTFKTAEQFRGLLPKRLRNLWAERGSFLKTAGAPIRLTGRLLNASERSMATSVNYFMQSLWDDQAKLWSKQGIKGAELEIFKRNYGDTINTFMKLLRAKSPTGKAIQKTANYILFSPSMTFSRPKRAIVLFSNRGSRFYAAQLIATEIAKIYALSAIAKIIGLFFRDDDEQIIDSSLDPRSSDWGKIKIGDTRIDLGGGDIQFYRTIAQGITGTIKSSTGKVVEIPRWDILTRYGETRETALIGMAKELITGRNFLGERIDRISKIDDPSVLGKWYMALGDKAEGNFIAEKALTGTRFLARHFSPSMVESMWESAVNGSWGMLPVKSTLEILSANTSEYQKTARAEATILRDKLAQREYGKNWEDLGPSEQEELTIENEAVFEEINVRIGQEKLERGQPELAAERAVKEQYEAGENVLKMLPKDLKKTVRDLGVMLLLSRRSGNWMMNDERFERYQKLAAEYLTEEFKDRINEASWKELSATEKIEEFREIFTMLKRYAREEITAEAEE